MPFIRRKTTPIYEPGKSFYVADDISLAAVEREAGLIAQSVQDGDVLSTKQSILNKRRLWTQTEREAIFTEIRKGIAKSYVQIDEAGTETLVVPVRLHEVLEFADQFGPDAFARELETAGISDVEAILEERRSELLRGTYIIVQEYPDWYTAITRTTYIDLVTMSTSEAQLTVEVGSTSTPFMASNVPLMKPGINANRIYYAVKSRNLIIVFFKNQNAYRGDGIADAFDNISIRMGNYRTNVDVIMTTVILNEVTILFHPYFQLSRYKAYHLDDAIARFRESLVKGFVNVPLSRTEDSILTLASADLGKVWSPKYPAYWWTSSFPELYPNRSADSRPIGWCNCFASYVIRSCTNLEFPIATPRDPIPDNYRRFFVPAAGTTPYERLGNIVRPGNYAFVTSHNNDEPVLAGHNTFFIGWENGEFDPDPPSREGYYYNTFYGIGGNQWNGRVYINAFRVYRDIAPHGDVPGKYGYVMEWLADGSNSNKGDGFGRYIGLEFK
ncbi:hypothetical protein K8I61_15800 [bacterium]|nr:hypothetical protein [bacterium]